MTTSRRPDVTPRIDERDACPLRAEPRRGAPFAMWMWRCAVVLPHPALHRTPGPTEDVPRTDRPRPPA